MNLVQLVTKKVWVTLAQPSFARHHNFFSGVNCMSYKVVGNTWDDIVAVGEGVKNVKNAINPALEIVRDPAFPQIVGMIAELHALEQPSSGPSVPGIGLRHLVPPLGLYVEFRKNPWVIGPLTVGAIIGIPFLLGYMFGKGR